MDNRQEREAVARIIDPKAWRAFDSVAEYQSRPQGEAPWNKYWADLAAYAKRETDVSLAKADAILALRPAGEPVAWRVRTKNRDGSWGSPWIATKELGPDDFIDTFGVEITPLGPISATEGETE